MDKAWWAPVAQLLGPGNTTQSGQLFFDRSRPGSICVNRLGNRFCNESISYDRFGYAMMEDHAKTGANLPCWMIFDGRYRRNLPISNFLPGWLRPDSTLPPDIWGSILYRADTVEELAHKINVDAKTLVATVNTVNGYAHTGKDLDFGRGDYAYDRVFGNPLLKPNSNLAPLDKPPYYAVKIELGDLGTKGGLKIDEHACVLDTVGKPIAGLYAVGNTTGSVFRGAYPGGGATLGLAMTFAYIAAEHALGRLTNAERSEKQTHIV